MKETLAAIFGSQPVLFSNHYGWRTCRCCGWIWELHNEYGKVVAERAQCDCDHRFCEHCEKCMKHHICTRFWKKERNGEMPFWYYNHTHEPTPKAREFILKAGGSIEEPPPSRNYDKGSWMNELGHEEWQMKGRVIFPPGTQEERVNESKGWGWFRYTLPTGIVLSVYSGFDPMAPAFSHLHVL